jgi:hypothetical protein
MKKFLLPILATILVVGMATIVWATVIGSPHDLAPEPCAMCHTPHSGTGDYPLWNRSQAVQTYTLYDSVSFDMGPAFQPRSPSALCLVCHNGVFSELVNYPGPCSPPDSAYDLVVAGCANLGLNLTNEHPISFNYDASLDMDVNQFPTATNVSTVDRPRYAITGAYSGTYYYLYAASSDSATTERWFECATCHSVHDLASYPGKGDYQVYFLRNDNTGSSMCLDCHAAR